METTHFVLVISSFSTEDPSNLVMAAEKVEKIVPKLKAEEEEEEEDEEPVDMAVIIKEKCGEEHCSKYKDRLDECNQRVKSKTETTETCFEEILDFYHCVDHCAAKDIFKHVK